MRWMKADHARVGASIIATDLCNWCTGSCTSCLWINPQGHPQIVTCGSIRFHRFKHPKAPSNVLHCVVARASSA